VYGAVRTVVWEDGGGDPVSYPISAGQAAIMPILVDALPAFVAAVSSPFYYALSSHTPLRRFQRSQVSVFLSIWLY